MTYSLKFEVTIARMEQDSAFRRYVESLAGETTTGEKLGQLIGRSKATAERRLNGKSMPEAGEIISIARLYGQSPLPGLVTFGYIRPDEADRSALTSFTDVELCQELLTRAVSRAIDGDIGADMVLKGRDGKTKAVIQVKQQKRPTVTAQKAETAAQSEDGSTSEPTPLRAERRRSSRTRTRLEEVFRDAGAVGDHEAGDKGRTPGPAH